MGQDTCLCGSREGSHGSRAGPTHPQGCLGSMGGGAWESSVSQGPLYPSILQLVPFLPSNIPHALETLSTGGLFSDGGHSFLQNL